VRGARTVQREIPITADGVLAKSKDHVICSLTIAADPMIEMVLDSMLRIVFGLVVANVLYSGD